MRNNDYMDRLFKTKNILYILLIKSNNFYLKNI